MIVEVIEDEEGGSMEGIELPFVRPHGWLADLRDVRWALDCGGSVKRSASPTYDRHRASACGGGRRPIVYRSVYIFRYHHLP